MSSVPKAIIAALQKLARAEDLPVEIQEGVRAFFEEAGGYEKFQEWAKGLGEEPRESPQVRVGMYARPTASAWVLFCDQGDRPDFQKVVDKNDRGAFKLEGGPEIDWWLPVSLEVRETPCSKCREEGPPKSLTAGHEEGIMAEYGPRAVALYYRHLRGDCYDGMVGSPVPNGRREDPGHLNGVPC
jgi:hypothetical protein